jgi:hypothetical protein
MAYRFITVTAVSIVASACLAATVLAIAPAALAQAPAQGFWNVQGRAVPGTRCSDWLVHLTMNQGRLTGVLGLGQGNQDLQNLALQPDGSFSATTPAGHVNNRAVRGFDISGRFVGDMVTVTIKNEICPDRTASAQRQPLGR